MNAKIVIASMFVLAIALIIIGTMTRKEPDVTITHFTHVFSDIDSDGDLDLIMNADVVLNGSTPFLLIDSRTGDTINSDDEDKQEDNTAANQNGEVTAVFTIFREIEDPLMSSGESYAEWDNRAARCPDDMPYWTIITLPGGEEFTCLHQVPVLYHKALNPGEVHISLLIDTLPVPLDTRVKVKVTYP